MSMMRLAVAESQQQMLLRAGGLWSVLVVLGG
jgi:hypothetical protein